MPHVCRRTYYACVGMCQAQVQTTPGLRERRLGVLQGLTRTDARRQQPAAWKALSAAAPRGGGAAVAAHAAMLASFDMEGVDELQDRVVAETQRIADAHPGTLLAHTVTHTHTPSHLSLSLFLSLSLTHTHTRTYTHTLTCSCIVACTPEVFVWRQRSGVCVCLCVCPRPRRSDCVSRHAWRLSPRFVQPRIRWPQPGSPRLQRPGARACYSGPQVGHSRVGE